MTRSKRNQVLNGFKKVVGLAEGKKVVEGEGLSRSFHIKLNFYIQPNVYFLYLRQSI